MTANLLRRAAALLDQVADRVLPSPWFRFGPNVYSCPRASSPTEACDWLVALEEWSREQHEGDETVESGEYDRRWTEFDREYHPIEQNDIEPNLGNYLVAMQPDVARGLAELLRRQAALIEFDGPYDDEPTVDAAAIAIARLVLGETA